MTGLPADRVLPDALTRAERLPALPPAAQEVLFLAESRETGFDAYARALAADPDLARRLLALANSSMFALGQEVSSLERAAMILGTKTVQLMAVAFSVAGRFPASDAVGELDFREHWRRSISAAVAGRELGRILGFTLADEAFLCGLLGNIGRIVLWECLSEEYVPLLERAGGWPTADEERAVLGFDHAPVGGALLQAWGLPAPLHLALTYQIDPAEMPAEAGPTARKLAEIANLARLCSEILWGSDKGAALRLAHGRARSAGLRPEQVDAVLLALDERSAETARLFDVDLGERPPPHAVLEEARRGMLQGGLDEI